MSYLVVGLTALGVSALTLFSGFGLGTLLMPAFALFFPLPIAVAATAVVHILNNLFKVALLARHAVPRIVLRFGVPAAIAAFPGAYVLTRLATGAPVFSWRLMGRELEVTPIGLTMGLLILLFAVLEVGADLRLRRVTVQVLPLGGLLSGFFGGLSGHQGALRAAFLTPLGLTPASFAATQAVLATMVDSSRLLVYGAAFLGVGTAALGESGEWKLVGLATLCAFAGAYLGKRLLPRVEVSFVRWVTGSLLFVVGGGLAAGIL